MPVDELEQRFLAMADLLAIEDALALAEGILIEEHKAEADHMRTAMASRATIEMAKGVLMAQMHCGPDAAFTKLRCRSSADSRKLRDVAADVVRACSD